MLNFQKRFKAECDLDPVRVYLPNDNVEVSVCLDMKNLKRGEVFVAEKAQVVIIGTIHRDNRLRLKKRSRGNKHIRKLIKGE
jgi:hypothetical protein